MPIVYHDWHFKALTQIWTGDVDTAQSRRADRFIPTGLLGSVRWWFEVVVRGLGGLACDPTRDSRRCPDSQREATEPYHHCVVCELFGCTGWARKFRLLVLDQDGKPQSAAIQKGATFTLRFVPLRPIRPEEWALIDLTLRLIAAYGALGGKTVYKPTEEEHRQSEQHHQDLGIVKLDSQTAISRFAQEELQRYTSGRGWRRLNHGDVDWASLCNFWCVRYKHLSRQDADASSFNRVLGRDPSKKCRDCGSVHDPPQKCAKTKKHPQRRSDQNPTGDLEKWLAGGRSQSKKVFSFKEPESARRTFGFMQSADELDQMRQRLKEKAWEDLDDDEFVSGEEIFLGFLGEGKTK